MKFTKFLSLILLVGMLMTACAPIINQPAPHSPATVAPTQTPGTAKTPAPEQGQNQLPAGVVAAQKALAAQLGVGVEQVKVTSSEETQWPNGCLGVEMPGRMCTMMVTPGYKVILEVGGQQYEYHTNQDGSVVLAASARMPQTSDKVLVWEQTENGACSRAEIGPKGVAYGTCQGSLTQGTLEPARAEQLTYLLATYQAFFQGTKAGTVQFNGQGQQTPTEAEMRSIGEWSKLVFMEAQGQRGGAAWGSAMAWHQEGGIAGLCNDIVIYMNGWAMPSSCKAGRAQGLNQYRLSASELAQMYAWVDQYKNFEYGQKDPAVADAMKVTLIFTGQGANLPSDTEKVNIAGFAAKIFSEASQSTK